MARAPEPRDECRPGGSCPTCNGHEEAEVEDVCNDCGYVAEECECPRASPFDTREEARLDR